MTDRRVKLRFYDALNDFLPSTRRRRAIELMLPSKTSVKDLIESLGVPHTEVNIIIVNRVSVDFTYLVGGGDRIDVYPCGVLIAAAPLIRLCPRPAERDGQVRFIVDANLGKLARLLRLLGFDTLYDRAFEDAALARQAGSQRRWLLTRDLGVLKRRVVSHGYFVRATQPWQQLREVVLRFELNDSAEPFRRCMQCNSAIEPVAKAHVAPRLPPNVQAEFDRFWRCIGCEQVYWQGSHYQRMRRRIAGCLAAPPN